MPTQSHMWPLLQRWVCPWAAVSTEDTPPHTHRESRSAEERNTAGVSSSKTAPIPRPKNLTALGCMVVPRYFQGTGITRGGNTITTCKAGLFSMWRCTEHHVYFPLWIHSVKSLPVTQLGFLQWFKPSFTQTLGDTGWMAALPPHCVKLSIREARARKGRVLRETGLASGQAAAL